MSNLKIFNMGGRKRQSLESWINECMVDPEKEGRLRCLSLMHRVNHTNGVEVHSCNLGGTLHVDKNGLTCSAGAGSIGAPGWHGFLEHGELVTR